MRMVGLPRRFAVNLKITFILFAVLLASISNGVFVSTTSAQRSSYTDGDLTSLRGVDGDYTVAGANTTLNNYTTLAVDAVAGTTTITVSNIADLNSTISQLGNLAVGDLLMIVQMQGATINTADTTAYGSVTSLNGAGNYEFVTVGSITLNTITINGEGCISGLRNGYTTAGRTQVIRVPQFHNLTVNSGASVTPATWNGAQGGIIALQMSNALILNGSISASGTGFRGGALDNSAGLGYVGYRSALNTDGAEKGEGIAGNQADYDLLSGRFGRGAPANGGGGGNNHNGGGGGGANGNNGNTWTGQGVMPTTPAAAWALDPGYIANGNSFTTSSGGGRGGYTYSSSDQDALTIAPGNILWGGDNRREVGGLGGRPLSNNPANSLFLGGGGGAGDANNSSGGAGGRGGGMVYIMAGSVSGSGSITANGANGANTNNTNNDAPGGGGGGGTVIVSSSILRATIAINADGGAGGNQTLGGPEAEGPGGGGGGYIAVRRGSPTRTATGGTGGTTSSSALTEFTRNGSTNGAPGQSGASISTIPLCVAPTAASVAFSGRVLTPDGRGLVNARVTLSDSEGNILNTTTSSFGYYRFEGVAVGRTYLVTVSSKRYEFEGRAVTVTDEVTEFDLVAAK